jgi:RNA recognition motif-containing protein
MELYIGRLSATTNESDLKVFFKKFVKDHKRIELRHVLTPQGEEIAYGYVNVDNDKLAQKAIKKLHMSVLNDQPVEVREYVRRLSNNDRRDIQWRLKSWASQERRRTERRGKHIVKRPHQANQWLAANNARQRAMGLIG